MHQWKNSVEVIDNNFNAVKIFYPGVMENIVVKCGFFVYFIGTLLFLHYSVNIQ